MVLTVRGCHSCRSASAATTSAPVTAERSHTTSITLHSASEIAGALAMIRLAKVTTNVIYYACNQKSSPVTHTLAFTGAVPRVIASRTSVPRLVLRDELAVGAGFGAGGGIELRD